LNAPPQRVNSVEMPSFSAIFQRDLGYVWNSLRRLGVPNRDLEDLSHDVFFRVYERLADFDRERPFRPWLFGFCFRVASDYRRRFANQREILGAELEPTDTAPNALDQLLQMEATSLAQHVLQCIELDRRAVFVMHDIDGSAIPEVADALGIPLNTAYSRLRLARAEFADGLRRERLRRGDR
jgi:RNA polymerase sigma-70 factor, ECF subfamily